MTELRLGQINTVDIDTSEFASANAVNTVQSNVTSLTTDVGTISANLNALPDSAANDYATYSTLSTLIDTVSSNASSHSSTFWEGYADSSALSGGYISNAFTVVSGVGAYFGDGGSWTQLATLASVNTVQDNVSALDNNAWVNANDYATYNTLSSLIDTVQDNVSSSSSNTSIVAGGTDLSNTTVFVEAGNGISLASNTTSKTVTISTSMSNVTSQEFTLDGSANSFTLSKSAANTHMILVFYNGIAQKPTSYTISGTTLTLSNTRPIAASSDLEVRYFDFFEQPGVSSSSGGGGGSYSFQGSNYGYTSGGNNPAVATDLATIDRFPFANDSNATDIADLAFSVYAAAGQSSSTSGYVTGGRGGSPAVDYDKIQKFPFSSNTNATDVGELTAVARYVGGVSAATAGYVSVDAPTSGHIDKFPFSSEAGSSLGSVSYSNINLTVGNNSDTHGYFTFDRGAPNGKPRIKFPFSSDVIGTEIDSGTSNPYVTYQATQSSSTHGYLTGGFQSSPPVYGVTDINKFSFSSDSAYTQTASLTTGRYSSAGQSSTTEGYSSGGGNTSFTRSNVIDSFLFSSDTNATDIADLSQARSVATGQQY